MTPAGLPHSEISGSKAVCAYPKLIAAYHVLHRFPEPRHPPCALKCLTSTSRFPQKNAQNKNPTCAKPATATTETYGRATASLHTSLPQHSLVKDRSPAKHKYRPRAREASKAPLLYPEKPSKHRTVASYRPNRRLLPATAHNGEYRSRTGDLLLAKQVLSQLS